LRIIVPLSIPSFSSDYAGETRTVSLPGCFSSDYAGEMAMKKRTPCYCALQAKMHYVDNIDMDDHLENLATFLAQRDNNVASTVQVTTHSVSPLQYII
jgi:hypothetical protein